MTEAETTITELTGIVISADTQTETNVRTTSSMGQTQVKSHITTKTNIWLAADDGREVLLTYKNIKKPPMTGQTITAVSIPVSGAVSAASLINHTSGEREDFDYAWQYLAQMTSSVNLGRVLIHFLIFGLGVLLLLLPIGFVVGFKSDVVNWTPGNVYVIAMFLLTYWLRRGLKKYMAKIQAEKPGCQLLLKKLTSRLSELQATHIPSKRV